MVHHPPLMTSYQQTLPSRLFHQPDYTEFVILLPLNYHKQHEFAHNQFYFTSALVITILFKYFRNTNKIV